MRHRIVYLTFAMIVSTLLMYPLASEGQEQYAFVTKWGTRGTGDGQFIEPHGIAVGIETNIYVADTSNHRIQKFTSGGIFLTKWGTWGSVDGQFSTPCDVAVDRSGNVYVMDTYNHRIQKFMSEGIFLTKWGTWGFADGQFNQPNGIDVDVLGSVYVADYLNDRVQKFDSYGRFLVSWGREGSIVGPWAPIDIAVDVSGNVYVVCETERYYRKFDSNGKFLTKVDTLISDGDMSMPRGIAVDTSGNVYIINAYNNAIRKFDPNGNFLIEWKTYGSGIFFYGPSGIAVDSSRNVYWADAGNHCIRKFKPVSTVLPPIADFLANPRTGAPPLAVSFTDMSQNSPTSWSWDFGDGITSASQNPTHTYTKSGHYTVKLTATNLAGPDTKTRVDYIVVDGTPPTTDISLLGTAGDEGWYRTQVRITLTAKDDISGVVLTEYRINSGAWQSYSGPFVINQDGEYTIEYCSKDRAGNKEAPRIANVKLDMTPPTTSLRYPA